MSTIVPANLEETTLRAIEVFKHPFCEVETPCQPVDFTDVFKDSAMVSKNPKELQHLSLGLFWMLESLGYVRDSIHSNDGGVVLSEEQKNKLLHHYFPLVVQELKAGGVWGAIYVPLAMIGWGLNDGELAELQIENIILGFTAYLQDVPHLNIDWGRVREKMGASPLEEVQPPKEAVPVAAPTPEPKPKTPPPSPVKEEPLPKKQAPKKPIIELPKKGRVRKPGRPYSEDPSQQPQKKIDAMLGKLTEVGGGHFQTLNINECTVDQILSRLPLTEKKSGYLIFILAGASTPIGDVLNEIKARIPEIVSMAREQLKPGGEVSIGIGYYAPGVFDRSAPLDSVETLKMRSRFAPDKNYTARKAESGLEKTLTFISKADYSSAWGDLEGATVKVLKGEPWASPSEDVERVVFVFNDFASDPENPHPGLFSESIELAKEKNVRFEIALCKSTGGFLPTNYDKDGVPDLYEGGTYTIDFNWAKGVLSYQSPVRWGARYDALLFMTRERNPKHAKYLYKALDPRFEFNIGLRNIAATYLGALRNPDSIPYLVAATEDPSKGTSYVDVRLTAIHSLAKIHDPKDPTRVVKILFDMCDPAKQSDVDIRAEAVRALVRAATPQTLPSIQLQLAKSADINSEPDEKVRSAAIRTLGEVRNQKAVLRIIESMDPSKEPSAEVRHSCILALRDLKTEKIIPYLEKVKSDPDAEVRKNAEQAIKYVNSFIRHE